MADQLSTALVLGSFGASCVLVFGFPDVPFSQPRNVILGHLLSSLIGLAFTHAFGATWWSVGLATGSAIAVILFITLLAVSSLAHAQKAGPPAPTHANVAYGSHERQVLDFWKAKSSQPTPVVFFIHGGGWGALDKANVSKMVDVPRLLKARISVATINYRYVHQCLAAKVEPPVKWPLEDAAQALQFVRSKAAEWNLDKQRIGACGGSAGACSSLWLALHDDMAQPQSDDPVARESTRLFCAAVLAAQTTLDPKLVREWMPNATYGGQAFGFRTKDKVKDAEAEFQRLFDARDSILPFIEEYSPLTHASADDPPLWISYSDDVPRKKGDLPQDPTHSVLYGRILEEKLKPLGVEIIVTSKAEPAGDFKNPTDYFISRLSVSAAKPEPKKSAAAKVLPPSGFVSLSKEGEKWTLVGSDGRPFFSTGINHCSSQFFLRSYNTEATLARYGKDFVLPNGFPDAQSPAYAKWAAAQVARVKDWGFGALGYHTDAKLIEHLPEDVLYIATLRVMKPLTYHHQARLTDPHPDPWSDEFVEAVRKEVKCVVPQHTARRNLIGYAFTDGWGHGGLMEFWAHLLCTREANSPAKQAWIALLKERYASAEEAAKAYRLPGLTTWDALLAHTKWPFSKTPTADEAEFLSRLVDRYYATVCAEIRALDPHHLILGDKLRRPSPVVVKAVAKHTDVILYETYLFGEESSAYASELSQQAGGKPVLMGDGGFGWLHDKKSKTKGPDMKNAEAARQLYADTLRLFAANPAIVGWHFCGFMEEWDEPAELAKKHDPDGVNDNGLIDPLENEHTALVQAVRSANQNLHRR
jgi:acetyl esterase/lipase